MMKILRADGYRLVRMPGFWVVFAVLLVSGTYGFAIEQAQFAQLHDAAAPLSVDLTPSVRGAYGAVPLAVTVATVAFANADMKAGGIRNLLCFPHARRAYVLARIAELLGIAVVFTIALFAVPAVVSLALGFVLEPISAVDVAVGLAGVALVSAAYAALPTAFALWGRAPTVTMVGGICAALGVGDIVYVGALALVYYAVPGLAGICQLLMFADLQFVWQMLKDVPTLVANTASMALLFTLALAWLALGLLASWVLVRRRSYR